MTDDAALLHGERSVKRLATPWIVPALLLLSLASHRLGHAGALRGEFVFEGKAPEVALVYFPEDNSLTSATAPTLDQAEKTFTPALAVGPKGAKITFKNSDSIAHNIFADDKEANVKFDVGLLNAGSEAVQDMQWENTVVKCSCKIHPQMRAWIASISSQYYKIVDLDKGKSFDLSSIPDHLSVVKVWLPNYDPVEFTLQHGESQDIELKKKSKAAGTLKLSRN